MMAVTPEHRTYLKEHGAITDSVIDSSGILSIQDGLVFPWIGPGLEEGCYQTRPDSPGDGPKYLGPKGVQLPFNRLRDHDDNGPVVIVEGTKQALSVLSHAPHHYAVYGLAGCRAWSGLPLTWVDDRDVVILFDGDMATNRDVHDAAVAFRDELEMAGAVSVAFSRIPSKGKQGVDDVLASIPEAERGKNLARWLGKAKTSPGKAPSAKRSNPFFGKDGLMVKSLALDILASQPAALTAEEKVAVYKDGVYEPNGLVLLTEVTERLGEQHRSAHLTSAEQAVKAQLYRAGHRLPDRATEPVANFTNAMVDLRTGQTLPHNPSYFSRVQHPIEWDPQATCPVYEQWIMEVIPEQANDLEEVAGSLFDRSRTPGKALFAYGPSHSGKSTFLRLLAAAAGTQHTSAVTLHALSEDRFAAANIYGKALNVSADLSARDVSDLETWKMLTGEDPVQANRKYGAQFQFTATALFAFSANELPAVAESSRAYSNRMKPFWFRHSFAGREDPGIEDKLRSELPGIIRRWVGAYRRRLERGAYLDTDPVVSGAFERGSDRVRQWVAETMAVVATQGRQVLPPDEATTATALSALFAAWARDNGGSNIGRNKLIARLTSLDGVEHVRIAPMKARGLNLITRGEAEQGFDQPSSGVAEVAEKVPPAPDAGFGQGVVKKDGVRGSGELPPLVPLSTVKQVVISSTHTVTLPFSLAEAGPDPRSETDGTDPAHLLDVQLGAPGTGQPGDPEAGGHPGQSRAVPAGPGCGEVRPAGTLPFGLASVRGWVPTPPPSHVGASRTDRDGRGRNPFLHRSEDPGRVVDGPVVRPTAQPEHRGVLPLQGGQARGDNRFGGGGTVRVPAETDLGSGVQHRPAQVNPFLPFTLARV